MKNIETCLFCGALPCDQANSSDISLIDLIDRWENNSKLSDKDIVTMLEDARAHMYQRIVDQRDL